MKIGIIGSRTFGDYSILEDIVCKVIDIDNITYIVSGGADGADNLAEKFAIKHSIPTIIHNANWKKLGKSAGFERNKDIIKDSDFVFAFWDGNSSGTKHSLSLCYKYKKPHMVIFFEDYNSNNLEDFLK